MFNELNKEIIRKRHKTESQQAVYSLAMRHTKHHIYMQKQQTE